MKALSFNGVTLTPISHNNQIYLSASELAKALGYSQADSVTRIYNRNADEFSADMTQIIANSQAVNLTVRIFSLRGCHLIAMFARTPIAKEFRRWVLDILDKEVSGVSIEPVSTPSRSAKLSAADYRKLQDVVVLMARGLKFDKGAEHAIYARLRSLCEVQSVKDIRYEQMGMVAGDLARINRTMRPYMDYRAHCEKKLFRRVCMGDDQAAWEAIQLMDETSGQYAAAVDSLIAQRLERIGYGVGCGEA